MPKKDVSTQCTLLPAPPLCFGEILDSQPEMDSDLDDELTSEADDHSDADYTEDLADNAAER